MTPFGRVTPARSPIGTKPRKLWHRNIKELLTMILGGFIQRQLPTIRFTAVFIFFSRTLGTKFPSGLQVSAFDSNFTFAWGLSPPFPRQFNNIAFDQTSTTSSGSTTTVRQDITMGKAINSEESSAASSKKDDSYLPTMIVFDLDGTSQ